MSVNGISPSDLAALLNGSVTGKSSAGTTDAASFASTLALQVSAIQSETLNSLVAAATGNGQASSGNGGGALLGTASGNATNLLDQLTNSSSMNGLGSVGGLSSSGRNMSLFDPESAYQMMSFINKQNVQFKAEYSELSDMGSYVSRLQQSAGGLQGLSNSVSNGELKAQLQQFVSQYNDWVKKFDGDMASGGALHNVQAAEESRYELEQSVNNMFNGAADGFNGLPSLGITIDPTTHQAKIDDTQLDAALTSNKQGVVNTVQQFAANFSKSADLLTSAGNFISNRLNNLSGALQYIGSHESALQSEFGTGDSYKASGAIAQAAAAYDASHTT